MSDDTIEPAPLRALPADQWGPDVRPILTAAAGTVADVTAGAGAEQDANPLPTLALIAHDGPLLGPFLGWAAALALQSALDKRLAELVALRTAVRCGSAFEWREHAVYARAAGLTGDEIDRIATGPAAPDWNALDRAVLQAADELEDTAAIQPATYQVLAASLSAAEIVDLILVHGQYRMLSSLGNTGGADDGITTSVGAS